jgi:hypothetical protein
MPEHFNKATVEAKFWCKVCRKPTMHYVHDGRRGGCHECIARREAEKEQREAQPAQPKQGDLFG